MIRTLAGPMLAASILATIAASSPPAGAIAGFGDVLPERFYTDAVQWMVDNDITTGTSANCFSPEDFVTRGQAAAFMWRMEGFPPPGADHPFDDVSASWQQDPVSWMFNNNITTGTSAKTFSPDDSLTRGQLAALVHRLAGFPDPGPVHPFGDVTAPWQHDPVSWMFNNNITTGTSATTFSPDDTVTRGQLAAFFHRYKGSPEVVFDPESRRCDPIFDSGRLFLFVEPLGNPNCIGIGVGPPPALDVVYECSTELAFAAGVPFFVSHGWTNEPELVEPESLSAGTRVDLAVDGVLQAPEEVFSDEPGSMSWRYSFRDGMTGTHTFIVEWYELGDLSLRSEVTVTFS